MPITVRLRHPNGTASLQTSETATLISLKKQIEEITRIETTRQELRLGFPPKPIPPATDDEVTLSSLGVSNGEVFILSEKEAPAKSTAHSVPSASSSSTFASLPPSAAPVRSVPPQQISQANSAQHSRPSLKSVLGENAEFVAVDAGFLCLRIVPDDNSCLFTAISLVLAPDKKTKISALRQIVADTIRADPETWSEPILGHAPSSYISKILQPSTWGGAIELSIFSSHFQTEICSIDVQTGRIDIFGQDNDFTTRVLIVYSGIHYDALTFSFTEPDPRAKFPFENLEFETTVFPIQNEAILIAAKELVGKLRAKHLYTDAANFTLKCEVCKTALVGEKEATAHAKETGHTRFGEYDG